MNEIITKLSDYNLFNYLFPGIVFCILAGKLTDYSTTGDNLVLYFFLFYLVGLVISRFGSLCIEPLLKKVKFLKFAEYKDFVEAEKKDPKISTLSEQNNMYRTLISLFSMLLLLKLYEIISNHFNFQNINLYILCITFLILFLISYKKQTKYIKKRVESNNQSN